MSSTRQWVTIVGACAAISLLVHMAWYGNRTQTIVAAPLSSSYALSGNGYAGGASNNTSATPTPTWARQLTTQLNKASQDITQLGDRLKDAQSNGADNKTLSDIVAKQADFQRHMADMATKLDQLALRVHSDSTHAMSKDMMEKLQQITQSISSNGVDVNDKYAQLTTELKRLSDTLATLQSSIPTSTSKPTHSANGNGNHPFHHWKLGDKESHAEKVALIIESRPVHRLIRVVKQFMSIMKDDWEFQIWFSNQNEQFLRDSTEIQTLMRTGRLRMYPMGRDVFDIPWYNQLMMRNVTFWDFVGGKHMLIFQVDATLCPNSPKKIEDFLGFDYCGAPWRDPWYGDAGGNGGLSLRGRDATLKCARDWNGFGANEDGYFTECVAHAEERGERKICRREVAKTFSVETIYYPTPWGVHNAWRYLSQEDTRALQQWCPEIADAQLPLQRDPPPT